MSTVLGGDGNAPFFIRRSELGFRVTTSWDDVEWQRVLGQERTANTVSRSHVLRYNPT